MKIPSFCNTQLLLNAFEYAYIAHTGQVRKFSKLPYITHPIHVAWLVHFFKSDENMIAAALLHDVIEDCGKTKENIVTHFNEDVGELVQSLTQVALESDGNRQARFSVNLQHLAKASKRCKFIKLADIGSNIADSRRNLSTMSQKDRKFIKIYIEEKQCEIDMIRHDHVSSALFYATQLELDMLKKVVYG